MRLLAAAAAALGVLVGIWFLRKPRVEPAEVQRPKAEAPVGAPAASPQVATAANRGSSDEAAGDSAGDVAENKEPWALPQIPKWGTDPDPFVRQRHDYPPSTPERLGPLCSAFLFDVERLLDAVERGQEAKAPIARARGAPLQPAEREQARVVLQSFFDAVTPLVDGVLNDASTQLAACDRIRELRDVLDRDLGKATSMTTAQYLKLVR